VKSTLPYASSFQCQQRSSSLHQVILNTPERLANFSANTLSQRHRYCDRSVSLFTSLQALHSSRLNLLLHHKPPPQNSSTSSRGYLDIYLARRRASRLPHSFADSLCRTQARPRSEVRVWYILVNWREKLVEFLHNNIPSVCFAPLPSPNTYNGIETKGDSGQR
jgi:hypothetical protein